MVRFDEPLLCLVTDRYRCGARSLEEVVDAAVEGGVGMVQLREKDLSALRLFDLAKRLRGITGSRALLFVNDRLDVALAVDADGVQLGEEGLSLGGARKVAGNRLLLSKSIHSVEGGVGAEAQGADLLVAGTIFHTNSHPDGSPQGPTLLQEMRRRVTIPYLGIGGITAQNVGLVLHAGAVGAAVISAITMADDPALAARGLMDAMVSAKADQKMVR